MLVAERVSHSQAKRPTSVDGARLWRASPPRTAAPHGGARQLLIALSRGRNYRRIPRRAPIRSRPRGEYEGIYTEIWLGPTSGTIVCHALEGRAT